MSSSESTPALPSSSSVSGTPRPDTAAVRPETARLLETPPTRLSVMCPMGFTANSVEGVSLDKPLFAKVTFTPL